MYFKKLMFVLIPILGFITICNAEVVSELRGKYHHSIEEYISFSDNNFTYQYTTTDFKPEERAREDLGEPKPERKTICIAKGSYTILSVSTIELNFISDSCRLKKDKIAVEYHQQRDLISIKSKEFRQQSDSVLSHTPSASASIPSFASIPSVSASISDEDVEAATNSWRWSTAKAMLNLNNKDDGIWYCRKGVRSHLSSEYWIWNKSKNGWIPKSSITPSSAVNWYFGSVNSDEACTECLMAARATFYKGLLNTLGISNFDRWFSNRKDHLVISYRSRARSPLRVNKPISRLSELRRGDWVYFQNWVSAATCPQINPLQGENAITQSGPNPLTYIGLGIPPKGEAPVSGDTILNELKTAWQNSGCPSTREAKLRKDVVATCSISYMQQVLKELNILQNINTNQTVSGISGEKYSRKFYKIRTSSNMDTLSIRIEGGDGNADLYIASSKFPTLTHYNMHSKLDGNVDSITISNPGDKTWYVMIHGSTSYSNLSLLTNDSPPATNCIKKMELNSNTTEHWSDKCKAKHRTNRYAKYYTFTLTKRTTIDISLESNIDTYLILLKGNSSDGNIVTYNDDSDGSLNSRIKRVLDAGTYTIESTTYYANTAGEFDLLLQTQ